jgi:Fe2+ transport system protein FeoA
MTTNLEIVESENDKALLIPAEAVSKRKGKKTVNVQVADGKSEEREVELGITDGVKVEVLKGLNEGDTLLMRKGAADSRWRTDTATKSQGFNPGSALGGGGGGGGGGGRR